MSDSEYPFGTSQLAADRLRIVARVFAEEMRKFISGTLPRAPRLARDLGCGPGHTTALLAEESGAEKTIGLDVSEPFIDLARAEHASKSISFEQYDVTAPNLPGGPCDLQFCHLLLTHLPDPLRAIEGWGRELGYGGLLLVDEVEAIEPAEEVLREYLAVVAALVQHSGGELYVGPQLDALAPDGLRKVISRGFQQQVSSPHAATMFRMNLETWRSNPFIVETYGDAKMDELATRLEALRDSGSDTMNLWTMRQIAYRKS
jgi:trans-aconitate 2-methyltransferase